MGVYIAGMKLPKACNECPCNEGDFCKVLDKDVFADYCVDVCDMDTWTRPAYCPMKEVAVLVGGRKIYEDNN